MLKVENVRIKKGHRVLCDNVTFMLNPGEAKALIAPNGYGKTTIMTAVGGCDTRARGVFSADGAAFAENATGYRKLVYYMAESGGSLLPGLDVFAMLEAARGIWASNISVAEAVERCGLLDYLGYRCGSLSQGMAQQASMGVAYITGARYLLLDEPMNGLDQANVDRFHELVRVLLSEGKSMLISSHILGELDSLCSTALFLHDGNVTEMAIDGRNGGCAEMYRKLYGDKKE